MTADGRYERPGQPAIEGGAALREFYEAGRPLDDGRHELEGFAVDGETVAVGAAPRGARTTRVSFCAALEVDGRRIARRYACTDRDELRDRRPAAAVTTRTVDGWRKTRPFKPVAVRCGGMPASREAGEEWTDQRGWDHHVAALDGIDVHYVTAGDPAAPPVVCLHGFPECWWAWRRHVDPLARRFRVLVPDLRGYNLSGKPPGVGAYGLGALVGDLEALLEREGHNRAVLLGHDWGGVVALEAALRRPALVDRLVVCNAPHPRALLEQFTLQQALRSWYVALVQLPRLPEWLLARDGHALLERGVREGPAVDGVFTDEDVAVYRSAWEREGALASMLNYYRAFARAAPQQTARPNGPIEPATLVLWGEQDPALGPQVPAVLGRSGEDVTVRRYPEAAHWPHASFPERSLEDVTAFLAR